MEYKDYYKILGVTKNASDNEIKQAYRRLARKFHPDVSKEPNAEDKFKNAKEAYEVLKDPEKRAAYNQLGSNWQAGQEFRPPPGWGGAQSRHYTSEDLSGFADEGGFSDFFTNLFGNARAQGGRGGFQQRGSDQRAKVFISLEDAFLGATKTLQLQVPEVDAQGFVRHKKRTLKINIPAGALAGQQLRLAGQGEQGQGGAPAGDLFLEIQIEPHPFFSLQGKDVYLTFPVTPWEAALGADIKVPTLGGTVGLKLNANSQTGQKLRLKGRGMPGKPNPGDQFAILQILIPHIKTEEDRAIFERMAAAMSFNPRKDWPL